MKPFEITVEQAIVLVPIAAISLFFLGMLVGKIAKVLF